MVVTGTVVPKCYKNRKTRNSKNRSGKTYEQLYLETQSKKKDLEDHGYKVIDFWDHDFIELEKKDKQFKNLIERFPYKENCVDPLNPRDSFFGGRTNTMKLYYKAKKCKKHRNCKSCKNLSNNKMCKKCIVCLNCEKIKYVDFTSEYPYVNKYGEYPIKNYQIIRNPDINKIHEYYGLIKCKMLPPTGLYHPVLPVKIDKLVFPLCRLCYKKKRTKCNHIADQRSLIGTWTSIEIQKAIQKGYKLIDIYEVWHFKKEHRKIGLFKKYVQKATKKMHILKC